MMKYYVCLSQYDVDRFLAPFQSVRMIRTNTTLDQDCALKGTVFVYTSRTVCLKAIVQVCTACMDVSLLTTCVDFNTKRHLDEAQYYWATTQVCENNSCMHRCGVMFTNFPPTVT